MSYSRTIIGAVVTEKAERQKAAERHIYTLWADKSATKIDVKSALEHFYDVEVDSVRVMRTVSKQRSFGAGQTMVKRSSKKKVLVTLKPKSKPLDLSTFKHQ